MVNISYRCWFILLFRRLGFSFVTQTRNMGSSFFGSGFVAQTRSIDSGFQLVSFGGGSLPGSVVWTTFSMS